MSAIKPELAFAVPMFLQSLPLIELGRPQAPEVLEHPKMMANTVLVLLGAGDDALLDVGDLAITSLAQATISLCDAPTESAAVAAYQRALEAWADVDADTR